MYRLINLKKYIALSSQYCSPYMALPVCYLNSCNINYGNYIMRKFIEGFIRICRFCPNGYSSKGPNFSVARLCPTFDQYSFDRTISTIKKKWVMIEKRPKSPNLYFLNSSHNVFFRVNLWPKDGITNRQALLPWGVACRQQSPHW